MVKKEKNFLLLILILIFVILSVIISSITLKIIYSKEDSLALSPLNKKVTLLGKLSPAPADLASDPNCDWPVFVPYDGNPEGWALGTGCYDAMCGNNDGGVGGGDSPCADTDGDGCFDACTELWG